MITKQQALEFLYELSQNFIISFDVTNNSYSYLNISSPTDFETIGVDDKLNNLELLVTKLVKEYMEVFIPYIDKIPVDIDMLEVGQTYKVHIQQDWEHRYFTAKFLGFDEEDNYVVKFENNKPCTKFDFREIYKVVE